MKLLFSACTGVVLAASLFMVGCNQKTPAPQPTPSATALPDRVHPDPADGSKPAVPLPLPRQ